MENISEDEEADTGMWSLTQFRDQVQDGRIKGKEVLAHPNRDRKGFDVTMSPETITTMLRPFMVPVQKALDNLDKQNLRLLSQLQKSEEGAALERKRESEAKSELVMQMVNKFTVVTESQSNSLAEATKALASATIQFTSTITGMQQFAAANDKQSNDRLFDLMGKMVSTPTPGQPGGKTK